MKLKFSKYLLSGLVLMATLGLFAGCKGTKCDCPSFKGEVVVEQAEQC